MSFKSMQKGLINTYIPDPGTAPDWEQTWALHELALSAGPHQLTGNERVIDTGKQLTADIRFMCQSTALEGYRIKWNLKMYEIVHIDDPMERGHHVELSSKFLTNTLESDYPDA